MCLCSACLQNAALVTVRKENLERVSIVKVSLYGFGGCLYAISSIMWLPGTSRQRRCSYASHPRDAPVNNELYSSYLSRRHQCNRGTFPCVSAEVSHFGYAIPVKGQATVRVCLMDIPKD